MNKTISAAALLSAAILFAGAAWLGAQGVLLAGRLAATLFGTLGSLAGLDPRSTASALACAFLVVLAGSWCSKAAAARIELAPVPVERRRRPRA